MSHMDLIKISPQTIGSRSVDAVDGRELHRFLGSGQQFSNWIKNRIEAYSLTEGADFIAIKNSIYSPPRIDYHITASVAKAIAMVERTDKGKDAFRFFIAREARIDEMNAALTAELSKIEQAKTRRNEILQLAKRVPLMLHESLLIREPNEAGIAKAVKRLTALGHDVGAVLYALHGPVALPELPMVTLGCLAVGQIGGVTS